MLSKSRSPQLARWTVIFFIFQAISLVGSDATPQPVVRVHVTNPADLSAVRVKSRSITRSAAATLPASGLTGATSGLGIVTTASAPANGLTIVPTFDSTITSDLQAATIMATINQAIADYKNCFSDHITVNITFQKMGSGLGQSSTFFFSGFTYSQYRAALVSHSTTGDDTIALAHLPTGTTNPVNGYNLMDITTANARALGLDSSYTGTDSTIGLNTSICNLSASQTDPTKYSLYAVACHEIDEALGSGSALNGLANGAAAPTTQISPEDLFRYTSTSGVRSFTTAINASSYFSIDGTADLAQFNQHAGGDFSDWYSYYGGNTPQVQDAYSTPGAAPVLGVELRMLDVLGYKRNYPIITPASLPQGTSGKPYNQTLTVNNCTPPSTFTVTGYNAGTTGFPAPAADSTAGTFTISGTPAPGTATFTVNVTDAYGASTSQNYSVVVNQGIVVSPATLPGWVVNTSGYSQTISASFGTGAKTLSLTSGAVPPGMTFTAASGVLNGIPTAAGAYNFTITATDTLGATGSQAYTVVIYSPPAINNVSIVAPGDAANVPKYGKVELLVNLTSGSLQPYNPNSSNGGIDLSATFTAPDLTTQKINGFYDGSNWRIRFAPMQTGAWTFTVKLVDGGGTVNWSGGSFTCVASSYPGFARIDGYYLRFTEGQAQFAIGHNNGWQYNVEQPTMVSMAAQGENLLSFWMNAPWKTPSDPDPRCPIENITQGCGTYNQPACAYIDSVVGDAEATGIYLLPSIWSHGNLRYWNPDNSADPQNHPWGQGWWANNGYSAICSATNFFLTTVSSVDTQQWTLQKNYYRYMLARWGYSRSIVGFVALVEIEGTTGYGSGGKPIGYTNPAQATTWCGAVRNYFASNDSFRLNSLGKYPIGVSQTDWTAGATNFASGCDLQAVDSYAQQTNSVAVAGQIGGDVYTFGGSMRSTGRPALISEFGASEPNNNYNTYQPTHLHNGLWAGFSSGGMMSPLLWCDEGSFPMLTDPKIGTQLRTQLQNLSQFVSGISYIDGTGFTNATISVNASNFNAWSMRLSDRGFGWIQNTVGNVGGQQITVSGLSNGTYNVFWYDTWSSGATPLSAQPQLIPVASGSLVATVPTPSTSRADLAFSCFLNSAPTVATIASASPSPVTGTTTTLSVLGADDAGEANLKYTWSLNSGPATVTYSINNSNAAKSTLATFTKPGSYSFTVTITDAAGATTTSSVTVVVNQTAVSIVVAPSNVTLIENATQLFAASGTDQFGTVFSPSVIWGVSGGGTINAAGLFTAGTVPGGPFTVTATASSASGTAHATVIDGTPTANTQSVTLNLNTATAITLTGSDPQSETLTFAVTVIPAHGVLTGTAPNLIYTPANGFNGSDSFQFTVKNTDNLTSAAATVSLTVNPGAPTANVQSVNVAFQTGTAITLTGSDPNTTPVQTPLTFTVTASPSHGALTGTAPNLTYTPANGFNGADSFQFTVKNKANLTSAAATVSLTVAAGTPTANAQSVNVSFNAAKAITLTASDPNTTPVQTPLTYTVTASPSHGALTGTAPNLTYTPANGFNGADSFQFTVTNKANLTSSAATVSLTVAAGTPTANVQSVNVPFNTGMSVSLTGSDPNTTPIQTPLTYTVTASPSHGVLTGTAPNLTYTPANGFDALDSFQFTVTNKASLTSSAATVSLTVASGTPTANAQSVNVPFDTATAVTLTGSDPNILPAQTPLNYTVTASPGHGVLSGTAPNLTYTPNNGFNGGDSFQFTVTNKASLTSSAATISLTVGTGVPTANSQSVNVSFNAATSITLTGSDPNTPALTPLTFALTASPVHGVLSGTIPNLTYTPNSGFNGADSFQFTVTNTNNVTSSPAIISLSVAPGTPTATAQSVNVPFNTGTSVTLTGSDPNTTPVQTPLTYAITASPTHGVLTGTAPNLTYTPANGFNGADSFQFTVTNKASLTSSAATVSLTVAVGTPTANAQSVNVPFNTGTSVTLTGSDPNATPVQTPLTYAVTAGPSHGVLTGTAPNLTYTPANGFNGADSFQFMVTNTANLTSNSAAVLLSVAAGSPTADAQSVNVAFNTSTAITLTGSDPNTLPSQSPLAYLVTTSPSHGTLTGTAPNVSYTPANGFSGADSFQFTVTNKASLASTAATVSLTVAANSAPTFTSNPTATPNPATVNQPVQFVAGATDADNDVLTYAWDFGDGSNGLGSSSTHTYSAAGVFVATVTVTDTASKSINATVTVTVVTGGSGGGGGTAPPVDNSGPFTISNPDGIPNEMQDAAGQVGIASVSSQKPLPPAKLAIKLIFAKPGNDLISMSGTLATPTGFTPSGQPVVVDIGGVVTAFTLNAKGKAKQGNNSFAIAVAKKGKSAASAKYTVKLSKSSFQTKLAVAGLTNANAKAKPVSIPIGVLFTGQFWVASHSQTYTATAGKTGATKDTK